MSIKSSDYEALLSEYCDRERAIFLLKQFRPYLEMLPSMRRPEQSLITIPLPIIKIRQSKSLREENFTVSLVPEAIQLPCDLGILMCDPEWKIKMGAEILIFIHRPQEDFSQLLSRWRKTQIYLNQDYEWLMPLREKHMFSEGAKQIYPLFIIFEKTLERIKKGLAGAGLPYLIQTPNQDFSEELIEVLSD